MLKSEDPLKLAQLREAPLKNLNDVLSPTEKHDLIAVDEKVSYMKFYLFSLYLFFIIG